MKYADCKLPTSFSLQLYFTISGVGISADLSGGAMFTVSFTVPSNAIVNSKSASTCPELTDDGMQIIQVINILII